MTMCRQGEELNFCRQAKISAWIRRAMQRQMRPPTSGLKMGQRASNEAARGTRQTTKAGLSREERGELRG